MRQHSRVIVFEILILRNFLCKLPSVFLTSIVFAELFLLPNTVLAQNKKFKVSRATDKEVMAYLGISTQVFCYALEEKIEYMKAGRIAARPVFSAINELHGSKVPGIRAKLSNEELSRWVDNNLVLRASNVCPKLIPEDILEGLEKFKNDIAKDKKKK